MGSIWWIAGSLHVGRMGFGEHVAESEGRHKVQQGQTYEWWSGRQQPGTGLQVEGICGMDNGRRRATELRWEMQKWCTVATKQEYRINEKWKGLNCWLNWPLKVNRKDKEPLFYAVFFIGSDSCIAIGKWSPGFHENSEKPPNSYYPEGFFCLTEFISGHVCCGTYPWWTLGLSSWGLKSAFL